MEDYYSEESAKKTLEEHARVSFPKAKQQYLATKGERTEIAKKRAPDTLGEAWVVFS